MLKPVLRARTEGNDHYSPLTSWGMVVFKFLPFTVGIIYKSDGWIWKVGWVSDKFGFLLGGYEVGRSINNENEHWSVVGWHILDNFTLKNTWYFLAVSVPAKRAKRKAFGVLSVAGKRKALRDVRSLFKTKEEEYETPTSAMAGFVIQQVTSLTFAYILDQH